MSRPPTLDDLASFAEPTSPVLTPDGTRVVYALTRCDTAGDPLSELRALRIDGDDAVLTSGAVDTAPAVSPDGETVAFVRAHDGTPAIHRIALAGGDPVALTAGLRVVGGPVFSPDGAHIAFTALIDDGAPAPAAPLVVADGSAHKVDGLGWVGTARTHVLVVPVAGGAAERVTVDGHCGSPAWSPDGSTIAFAQSGVEVEGVRFARRIGLVSVADPGGSVRFPFAATGVAGPLAWTPDGASIIAIGDLEVGVGLDRLVRLDLADGAATVITSGLDRNVMGGGPGYPGGSPAFGDDGRLYCCVRDGGQTVVLSLDLETRDVRRHAVGDTAVVSGLSVARGRAVVRVSDASVPAELELLELEQGSRRRLTDHLTTSVPGVAFLAPRAVRFSIADGTEVHGWLLRAPSVDGPAPTLLDIHGGPHNAWTGTADTAHLYHQLLAAQGWNVLTLNPRGSDGYGEAFFTAAVGGWGEMDEPDFLEPLDRLVADGVADPDRLAVTGYSYGGFMTCWLTSRTDRFRAAVPGGLVCDLHSANASSDLGAFLHDIEVGGAENAERLSPTTRVGSVTTPSLILHGQDDQRCPLGQAELWHARLRERGVKSELVVYPEGSHLFILNGPLSHRRDYNQRVVDWVVSHTT